MQDFSLSFLIYLVITFLVHLYQNTGQNATKAATVDSTNAQENGYAKVHQHQRNESQDGPEAYELTEQDMSGDEDAVKIGTEDEVDWMRGNGSSVRI